MNKYEYLGSLLRSQFRNRLAISLWLWMYHNQEIIIFTTFLNPWKISLRPFFTLSGLQYLILSMVCKYSSLSKPKSLNNINWEQKIIIILVWQRPKDKLPHADLTCNFYTSVHFQINLVSISPMFYAHLLCIPKIQKKTMNEWIFAFLGSVSVKAARKMLIKSTPHWFWSISVITLKMECNKYMLKDHVPISLKANTECIKDLDWAYK